MISANNSEFSYNSFLNSKYQRDAELKLEVGMELTFG